MSGLWQESEKLKAFDKTAAVLKHGTLSIGYIGLAECLTALTGKHHGETKRSPRTRHRNNYRFRRNSNATIRKI